jgi:hypothetical protein
VPEYFDGGEGSVPVLGDGSDRFLNGAIDGLAEKGREPEGTGERYHSRGYGQGSVLGVISESGVGRQVSQSDGGPHPPWGSIL